MHSLVLLRRLHCRDVAGVRELLLARLPARAAVAVQLASTRHGSRGSGTAAARTAAAAASSDAAAADGLTAADSVGADSDSDAAGPGPGSLRDAAAAARISGAAATATAAAARELPLAPGLYIIPTPIGNLQDITARAADHLRRVSLLLAEDTRHTRKLLNHLGIRHVNMLSYHDHNEKLRLPMVLQRIQQGEPVGLVSDAGTPGISDPGAAVVAAAVAAGLHVVALPGPCALVPALVASGLPTAPFTFAGFLPPKQGARRRALEQLAAAPGTLVLYAPPHGLAAVLADCVEVLGGGRRCCVAREVSKMHEEYFRSTLSGALREFGQVREARGEVVLLIDGAAGGAGEDGKGGGGGASEGGGVGGPADATAVERVLRELLEGGSSVSAAVREVVEGLGANKKAAYSLALRLAERLRGAAQQQQQEQQQDG